MKPRQLAKAETRKVLVDAARELFVAQGVEGTTTREVAERAGVGVGTVFAHFPDKATLVEAVLVDEIDAALAKAFADLPPADLVAQLVHVGRALYGTYAEHPSISRSLVADALFLTGEGRASARQMVRFRVWVQQRLDEEGRPLDDDDFIGFFALYFTVLVSGLRGEIPFDQQDCVLERLLRRWFGGVG